MLSVVSSLRRTSLGLISCPSEFFHQPACATCTSHALRLSQRSIRPMCHTASHRSCWLIALCRLVSTPVGCESIVGLAACPGVVVFNGVRPWSAFLLTPSLLDPPVTVVRLLLPLTPGAASDRYGTPALTSSRPRAAIHWISPAFVQPCLDHIRSGSPEEEHALLSGEQTRGARGLRPPERRARWSMNVKGRTVQAHTCSQSGSRSSSSNSPSTGSSWLHVVCVSKGQYDDGRLTVCRVD